MPTSFNNGARAAKRILTKAFNDAGIPFAEDDALEIILSATGLDKTGLILQGGAALTPEVSKIIQNHMNRRLAGEPVDHILGWREFYGRRFIVSGDVLSPRADTESLIRGALSRLENFPKSDILDMGTGSGAIGLTILAERSDAQLTATDISAAALDIAKKNAARLGVIARSAFRQGFWWEAVPDMAKFQMIVSNPPYISNSAMEGLEVEVKAYDPDLALRGGVDGLDAYKIILSQALDYLKPMGWLGFEIGFDQGPALLSLLRAGPWTQISCDQDLGGLDRVVWAQKSD